MIRLRLPPLEETMNRAVLLFLFSGLIAGLLAAEPGAAVFSMRFDGLPDHGRLAGLFADPDDGEWDDDEDWDDEDWDDDRDDRERDDAERDEDRDDDDWDDEGWEDEDWDEDDRYVRRRRNRSRRSRGGREAEGLGHRRHVSLSMDYGLVIGEFAMSSFGMEVAVRTNDLVTLMAKLEFFGGHGDVRGVAFDTGARFYFLGMKRMFGMYADARASFVSFSERWTASGLGISGAFGVEWGRPWLRGYLESGMRVVSVTRSSLRTSNSTLNPHSRSEIRRMTAFQWSVLRIGLRVHF